MTTFRFNPLMRWGFTALVVALVVGLPIVSAAGAASRDEPIGTALAMGLGIAILASLVPLLAAWWPKLTVSAEGLTLRGIMGFGTRHVRWDEIECLLWKANDQALVLRKSDNSAAAILFKYTPIPNGPRYDQQQKQLIQEKRYVPMSGFAWCFRRGPLLAEFRRHAPHLVEQFDVRRNP